MTVGRFYARAPKPRSQHKRSTRIGALRAAVLRREAANEQPVPAEPPIARRRKAKP